MDTTSHTQSIVESVGKVGVLLGGKSRERPISLKSGRAVYKALKNSGIDVIKIDTANGFRSGLKHTPIDLAFVALHGSGGEDGAIQRILERFRVPYVGSNPTASACAFEKSKAKKLFIRHGIPTADYAVVTRGNWRRLLGKWSPPYVIKPVDEGSSIGVVFVEDKKEEKRKIESSLRRYPRLIIERKIEGREFTVGILGEQALPVIELKPKRKFYDYKAKYTKGLTDYLIPAPISESLAARLQSIALKAHRILRLRDLSRVDIMTNEREEPFVLEVNSIPGFTETSLLPKAARQIGIEFDELCLRLLELAARRNFRKFRGQNG